ncbi:MAG: DNA repair protein RecO C-terminal domain-containing protein, partial [Bacteroidales bacterium]|nr:DNA repair protein RecO C-terminal domain-containing protein [Bacteroidales bacterium]
MAAQHNTEMIILNSTKVGESALVVHTLSRLFGRRSFILKGKLRQYSSLMLPLSIIEAEIVENPKSDLWMMKSLASAKPLMGIRSNMSKNAVTMFISELLFRSLKDGSSDEELYDWCISSIDLLDRMEGDFANWHLRFMLEFCSVLGFRPSEEDLLPFSMEYQPQISLLMQSNFAESMLIPLSGSVRNAIAEAL